MNIHITDNDLFTKLMESALFQMEFGSNLYGLKNSHSDTDYLVIYADSVQEELSSYLKKSHHNLQYKDDNKDYVFISLSNFIYNLINGGSLVNFEVIHTNEFKESILSNIINDEFVFYNKTTLKGILGLAKRDIKEGSNKKVCHSYRALNYFKDILKGSDLDLELKGYRNKRMNKMKNSKSKIDYRLRESISRTINNYRKSLFEINFKDIYSKDILEIDKRLIEFKKSEAFKTKQKDINLDIIYSSLKDGIKY